MRNLIVLIISSVVLFTPPAAAWSCPSYASPTHAMSAYEAVVEAEVEYSGWTFVLGKWSWLGRLTGYELERVYRLRVTDHFKGTTADKIEVWPTMWNFNYAKEAMLEEGFEGVFFLDTYEG